MDLAFSEEQQMLKETARKFLEKECPKTLVRELLDTPEGHSPALWNRIVDLGWLVLPFPEQYGGMGASFLDLAVILEEIGRALLPAPFCSTVLLGGYPILDAGTEAQKAELLPRVASGEVVLTMAWLESGADHDPRNVALTAKAEGDGFVLNGVKVFVPYAHLADTILTVARTLGTDGLGIFLVDRNAPGVSTTLLKPIDNSKLCEVSFDGVRVKRSDVLGEPGGAGPVVEKTLARAAVAECLQLVGGAQVALDMSVEHAKNRVQFGQAVGAFQAVQHHCANMVTDLDAARYLVYEAAWTLSEGLPYVKEVAMAKSWAADACYRVIARAHQVHGGVGFIGEHDLTLYFKRTKTGQLSYGDSNFHYRALAQALGL